VVGFYSIFLIVALVGVSGLIAYVGDVVARRLGRKRLTLFGMRPRHTAIAVSVVVGMLINIFTLTAAMLISRDVKDGFLRVEYLRRQSSELRASVDSLNRRIADLDRSRSAAEASLAARKADLEKAQGALATTHAALLKEQQDLARTEAELAKTKRDLARVSDDLKRATEVLTRQYAILAELQKKVDALRIIATRAEQEYALERATPILFGAGQPLDVALIPPGQSPAGARAYLDRLLADLNAQVVAAGARPLPGSGEAIIIRKPVRDPKTSQVVEASADQVLDAVVGRLRESSDGVIVRACSVLNTHPGEPVYVDFQLFRNLLVFRRGEALAETVIDGRLTDAALMAALVSLLRDEVGAKARAQNVMPRLTPGHPSVFGAAGGAVGEMSYEQLFHVIETLRQANGPARVKAIAAQDTWTVGPLEVDLRVEPVRLAAR